MIRYDEGYEHSHADHEGDRNVSCPRCNPASYATTYARHKAEKPNPQTA